TINNFGTTNMVVTSSFAFSNGAVWNNRPGALFVMPDSSNITNFFAGPNAAFNNFGTVQKSTPPGVATINVPFNNFGLTQVQSGVLTLSGGRSNSGTYDVSFGAQLNLSGAHSFQAGATTTGAGTVQVPNFSTLTVAGNSSANNLLINGGTLTANAPFSAANLTISGTVNGGGAVNVSNNFTWANGVISGAGALNLNGSSSMSGGFFSRLDGKTVNNAGTATVAIGGS